MNKTMKNECVKYMKQPRERRGELKPCPFCGKKPRLWGASPFGPYYVTCENRKCKVFVDCAADTREQVVEAWNTRS